MQVTVAESTRTALVENRTIRCLYLTKYKQDIRWSAHVVAWAQKHAEGLGRAIVEAIFVAGLLQQPHESRDEEQTQQQQQQPTAPPCTVCLVMVNLIGVNQRAQLCFDIFLGDGSDTNIRRRAIDDDDEQLKHQPIHLAQYEKGGAAGVVAVRRDPGLDAKVADRFQHKRTLDHGPKPLYWDSLNIPLYSEGRRLPDEERAQLLKTPMEHSEVAGRQRRLEEEDTKKTNAAEKDSATVSR